MSRRVYLYNEISGAYTLSAHDGDIYSEPLILYSNVRKQNKFIKYNNKAMRYVHLPWSVAMKRAARDADVCYYYNMDESRLDELKASAPHMRVERAVTQMPCKRYSSLSDL